MEPRVSSGVPQPPDLKATDLQARALGYTMGQLCGHWAQGYGLAFQSGHLKAS